MRVTRTVPKRAWWGLVCAVGLVCACTGQAPAPGETPQDSGGLEWVELDEDLILENFPAEEPAPDAEPVTLSLAEASAALPFTLALPAYMPEGFVLQDQVEVVQTGAEAGYASVVATWQNGDAAIQLQVSNQASGEARLGGAGRTETVAVNGQPATLGRGTQLGPQRLTLSWTRDNLVYQLSVEDGAASAEELVRIAESIP